MKMVFVIVLIMFLSLWIVSNVNADNTMKLKILSCRILHDTIIERLKAGAKKEEILKYGNQWIKNCTRTEESFVTQEIE